MHVLKRPAVIFIITWNNSFTLVYFHKEIYSYRLLFYMVTYSLHTELVWYIVSAYAYYLLLTGKLQQTIRKHHAWLS